MHRSIADVGVPFRDHSGSTVFAELAVGSFCGAPVLLVKDSEFSDGFWLRACASGPVHPEVVGRLCGQGPECAHLGRSGFVLRADSDRTHASFGFAPAAAWKAALRTGNFGMHRSGQSVEFVLAADHLVGFIDAVAQREDLESQI